MTEPSPSGPAAPTPRPEQASFLRTIRHLVSEIEEMAEEEDDEFGETGSKAAEVAEALLYKSVLEIIATRRCLDPQAVAEAALATQDIAFARSYE